MAERGRVGRRGPDYDGELAGSILLEDGDTVQEDHGAGYRHPPYSFGGGPRAFGGASPFLSGTDLEASAGSSPPASLRAPGPLRSGGEGANHTPTRTPSPVYQWNHPKKVSIGDEDDLFPSRFPMPSSPTQGQPPSASGAAGGVSAGGSGAAANASSAAGSSSGGGNPYEAAQAAQAFNQFAPFFANPLVPGGAFNPLGGGLPNFPMENYMQMMLALQAAGLQQAQGAAASNAGTQMQGSAASTAAVAPLPTGPVAPATMPVAPLPTGPVAPTAMLEASREASEVVAQAPPSRGGGGGGGGAGAASAIVTPALEGGKRGKNRGKDAAAAKAPALEVAAPKEKGGKAERRRRGGGGGAAEEEPKAGGPGGDGGKSSKSRSIDARPSSNPIIEQLKARGKIELSDLTWNIAEIAQDQYGSRLIQQKLEVANEEEKQRAFKSILQNMPQLTVDVFGNYVIQKFFEYGSAEQRRILAEQLVGQVMNLSLQMYGCRVVQKALDSVPIEQQVLLIGELKGHVIKCIEDQHGNHVIQKCIERLPTDKINFIVESFDEKACRMAKHCYGCRVIQRLIEYCSSMQISTLLDEVLRNCMDLGTDQYGNYVVQHVMEHSNRPNDRASILFLVRKNINQLSCHKYASNVVEKALACSHPEERAMLINAIVGEPGDSHPPLLTMMRDRFGNYIVQRTISLAQSPQREALLWKLQEQMPLLKKSNTYGKHIISAIEKAQAQAQTDVIQICN